MTSSYGADWPLIAHKNLWISVPHVKLLKEVVKDRLSFGIFAKPYRFQYKDIFQDDAQLHPVEYMQNCLKITQVPITFFMLLTSFSRYF